MITRILRSATDGDLLDQVLMNYLSNAIRYTPEASTLRFGGKNRKQRAPVRVQ